MPKDEIYEILLEMFGPDATEMFPADRKPWHQDTPAKMLDRMDFVHFVYERFPNARPGRIDECSIEEIAEMVDAN